MRNRIAESWAKFEASLMAGGGISDNERRAMRVAFYGGACTLFYTMSDVPEGEGEQGDIVMLGELMNELEAFDAELDARRGARMKRYFEEHNGPSQMGEHPDGEWVKADDALAEVERLRAVCDQGSQLNADVMRRAQRAETKLAAANALLHELDAAADIMPTPEQLRADKRIGTDAKHILAGLIESRRAHLAELARRGEH